VHIPQKGPAYDPEIRVVLLRLRAPVIDLTIHTRRRFGSGLWRRTTGFVYGAKGDVGLDGRSRGAQAAGGGLLV